MKRNDRSTLSRLLSRIRRHRAAIAASLALSAAVVALTLYIPYDVGRAVDVIAGCGADPALLAPILLEIALCAAAAAAAQWCAGAINNRVACEVVRDLRADAMRKISELPLAYIDAHPHGETVSRVVADADTLSDGLLMGFTQLFSGALTILGTLVIMFSRHAGIAAVVVLVTPVSLFVARFIARRTHDMFLEQSRARGEMTAFIDEMIGGARVVKAFGRGEKALADLDVLNSRLEKSALRATFFSSLTNPCTRFVNALVYAGVALSGGLAAIQGAVTVGLLTSFLSYANQYTRPFNEISGVLTELQNALACASRLLELIDEPSRAPDAPDAAVLRDVRGSVELDDVSFSYVKERPLIEHLSQRVSPGMRVAIVGPTGCGKTTVINLLMRFYDVDGGAVRVEGKDIRRVTRGSLRASYGMVLQETWLKSGTVRENLAMGRPDAPEEEIVAAAKAAHAHSFIRRLPQGYDTVLGEDGGTLSQGQKQLMCIARVMLCLPPMLILDEATSSIDTRTEMKIQSAFARMMEGRTSFIVAHRLSTIRSADVILVMRDGHIVEQGTHAELLAKNGFYAAMYNAAFE